MNGKYTYALLFICSSLVCILIFLFSGIHKGSKEISQLSFIYRGSAREYSQSAIKQGIEQASKDFGVQVSVQFLNNTGSVDEQLELIDKEVEKKAERILIEPVNRREVMEKLEEIKGSVPVVLVNTGIDEYNGLPRISCDNYQLGCELANKILENGQEEGKVLLAVESLDFQDIANEYQGVLDTLGTKREIEILKLPKDEQKREKTLIKKLKETGISTTVVFSSADLEMLGKMKMNELCPKTIQIYGTGKSNQIITDLEEGIIQEIGVVNDYSVGYLSVQIALNGKSENKEIRIAIIDKSEIYERENQRLLFNLVQ